MAAKKPPYSAKVKLWLPTYTAEFEGGAQGCVIEMFACLPVEQQAKALEKMQAQHQKQLEREAAKADTN